MKPLVAMVGWRGMVGSVLMKRMHEEHDFDLIRAKFFRHQTLVVQRQWVT